MSLIKFVTSIYSMCFIEVFLFFMFVIFISLNMVGYKEMQKETSKSQNVFYEEKRVCNRGRVRFQYDLALQKNYPVSKEFAAAVCSLPEKYNQRKYFKFIEDWGTVSVLNLACSLMIVLPLGRTKRTVFLRSLQEHLLLAHVFFYP